VEDEHWCKLPVPGWLAGLEVVLDLASVQLVDVLECSEAVDGRPHLDNCLLDLAFEHFRRVKIGATLRQTYKYDITDSWHSLSVQKYFPLCYLQKKKKEEEEEEDDFI